MTDQLSVPLTDDEAAILDIAAQGMPMIRLEHGRWTETMDSLLKRGFLKDLSGDKFNCVITDAGRDALSGAEVEANKALGRAVDGMRERAIAQRSIQEMAEQCAHMRMPVFIQERWAIESEAIEGGFGVRPSDGNISVERRKIIRHGR